MGTYVLKVRSCAEGNEAFFLVYPPFGSNLPPFGEVDDVCSAPFGPILLKIVQY